MSSVNILALLNLYHCISTQKRNKHIPRITGSCESKTVQTVDEVLSLLTEPEKNLKNISCINLKKKLSSEEKICIVCVVLSFF